jgi:hypothetical protein
LVEVHYAFWGVMTVPLGFAGLFFLVPGLLLVEGFILLAIAGVLLLYIVNLTRLRRVAWLVGLLLHLTAAIAAIYYVPRWPTLVGVPLLVVNLYSLIVLAMYRRLWTGAEAERVDALLA